MTGNDGSIHNYSVNAYFQKFQIAVDMLDDGELYPVQLPIVFFDGLDGTVRDQYLGQNSVRPMKSLTNIAMIKKIKTLKNLLLYAEKEIATTKSIGAIIEGTGGRHSRGGAPLFAALPSPTDTNDTEGLTVPVLAALEGMFTDKAHADTILV